METKICTRCKLEKQEEFIENLKGEIWKDIQGYENKYQVSNLGRIKSLNYHRENKEGILKPSEDKDGYLKIDLCLNKKHKPKRIHRLVAMAFIPNPNNYPQINHIDEVKKNNNAENLEWCTNKYNINHGTRNKRMAEKNSKEIYQYSKDKKLIKKWTSVVACCKECGNDRGTLIKHCINGTVYKDYIWSYTPLE